MTRIVWSPRAIRDLTRLFAFLQPKDPAAAAAAVDAIDQATSRLMHFPFSAPEAGARGLRKLSVGGDYVLLYRPTSGEVRIVRVHHATENWSAP